MDYVIVFDGVDGYLLLWDLFSEGYFVLDVLFDFVIYFVVFFYFFGIIGCLKGVMFMYCNFVVNVL